MAMEPAPRNFYLLKAAERNRMRDEREREPLAVAPPATPQSPFDINAAIKRRGKLVEQHGQLRAIGSDTRRERATQVALELDEVDRQIAEHKRKARDAARQAATATPDQMGPVQPPPSQSPAYIAPENQLGPLPPTERPAYTTPLTGYGGMRHEGGEEAFINPGGETYSGSVATVPAEALVPGAVETAGYGGDEFLLNSERLANASIDLQKRAELYAKLTGGKREAVGPFDVGTPGQRAFGPARAALDKTMAARERIIQNRLLQFTPMLTAQEERKAEMEARAAVAASARTFKLSDEASRREFETQKAEADAKAKKESDRLRAHAKWDSYHPDEVPEIRKLAHENIDLLYGNSEAPGGETAIEPGAQDLPPGARIVGHDPDGTAVVVMDDETSEETTAAPTGAENLKNLVRRSADATNLGPIYGGVEGQMPKPRVDGPPYNPSLDKQILLQRALQESGQSPLERGIGAVEQGARALGRGALAAATSPMYIGEGVSGMQDWLLTHPGASAARVKGLTGQLRQQRESQVPASSEPPGIDQEWRRAEIAKLVKYLGQLEQSPIDPQDKKKRIDAVLQQLHAFGG